MTYVVIRYGGKLLFVSVDKMWSLCKCALD